MRLTETVCLPSVTPSVELLINNATHGEAVCKTVRFSLLFQAIELGQLQREGCPAVGDVPIDRAMYKADSVLARVTPESFSPSFFSLSLLTKGILFVYIHTDRLHSARTGRRMECCNSLQKQSQRSIEDTTSFKV